MIDTLVIVRHGNTFVEGEPPRRIGARTDLPLVESGRAQARRLGAHFTDQQWRFDRILCSPLHRTRETGEAIRSTLGEAPALETTPLLAEIDHGPDEDAPEDAVLRRIGADALAGWDRDGSAPPGWVVDREARLRGWRELLDRPPSGRTLLITSNGAARFALLAHPHLAEQAVHLSSLKLRTGACGVIEIHDDGPRLAFWDLRP